MPDFLDGIDLEGFNLPAEAVRLSAPSPAPRTAEEIERRNRLVLEAAFPEAIRKIYGAGWRPTMMVYCVVGLVVACLFWWLFRDDPRRHPECNASEIALIEGAGAIHDPAAPRPPLPITCMLTSRGLWISSLVQFLTNIGWAFLITWLAGYLGEKYNVPAISLGLMTSLPIFVGMAGMFCGGWLTDAMTLWLGRRWGRAAPLALTRYLVAAAFASCIFLDSPWPVVVAMSVVALATDLGTPAIWAYSMDVGGQHVGSVLGWSNMFGNIGAALSPILLNLLLENSGPNGMFLTCAAALALAGTLALFLDATKPIVPVERVAA
jgi:ACS family glucarate transporter-like MFS transporter